MLQAEGIWRARVVLTGRPMEGSVLSLMRTHKHLGVLAFTFWVSWQHSAVGFLAVPLTNGMQAARLVSCCAHSCSSCCSEAWDAITSEATTMHKNAIFLWLPIIFFLLLFCYLVLTSMRLQIRLSFGCILPCLCAWLYKGVKACMNCHCWPLSLDLMLYHTIHFSTLLESWMLASFKFLNFCNWPVAINGIFCQACWCSFFLI